MLTRPDCSSLATTSSSKRSVVDLVFRINLDKSDPLGAFALSSMSLSHNSNKLFLEKVVHSSRNEMCQIL